MRIIMVGDSTVEIIEDAEIFYACYIKEQDIYFNTKISEGDEMIIRKAKAMIESYNNFIKEYPQYKK